MTDAPERIWHSIDRKGKINGSPDAHVQPCEGSLPAYVEYVRADLSTYAAGIEAAARKVDDFAKAIGLDAEAAMDNHPQIGEDRAEYADDARDVAEEIRALTPSAM